MVVAVGRLEVAHELGEAEVEDGGFLRGVAEDQGEVRLEEVLQGGGREEARRGGGAALEVQVGVFRALASSEAKRPSSRVASWAR